MVRPSRRHLIGLLTGMVLTSLTLGPALALPTGAETTHEANVAAAQVAGSAGAPRSAETPFPNPLAMTQPTPAATTILISEANRAATAANAHAAPAALTAEEAIAQITAADGTLHFDVAEDGTRFVWSAPRFDDDLPAPGATYISHGYIYPDGTLSETVDGVNADGSPEFPEQVVGQWACYGWYIGEGAHATEGPWVLSTQIYDFGSAWGAATLVSEGYVLANTDGTVQRAITGGTGPFATVRGEMADTNLGFNETEGSNARYEVSLVS
jgi:hypothetical protein